MQSNDRVYIIACWTSGPLPLEAHVMIAEKRKLFFSFLFCMLDSFTHSLFKMRCFAVQVLLCYGACHEEKVGTDLVQLAATWW